jgi:hypothetical protein
MILMILPWSTWKKLSSPRSEIKEGSKPSFFYK